MNEIESHLQETRQFEPPREFSKQARIRSLAEYKELWEKAQRDPEEFWGPLALNELHWNKNFSHVLSGEMPFYRWFEDGTLNACYNCIDVHLASRGHKTALIWEGEPGDHRQLSYQELHEQVCLFANGLESLGFKKGDVATIYMPMVPELAIAVLACARLGITHNVVFGGFSAEAISERNNDSQARLIITADGGWRRGRMIALKDQVDKSLEKSPNIERVIVLKRTGQDIHFQAPRDVWWHDLVAQQSPTHQACELPAEHPLFVLYTSGSTGKPKGIVHTTAGYLLATKLTTKYVFDLKEDDIYWCTADIGWITGHSYIVYGPLANGATVFMYEGAPDYPDYSRFWQMIEKYKISIFYTAPTAIRAFMRAGDDFVKKYDLSSLRLLGSVGEPINPEAWMWYFNVVGNKRCPIVDTWWQTETGSIMLTTLPGAMNMKPGAAGKPMFGVVPEIVDKKGQPVPPNEGGFLVISQPWPSMARTILGDNERYQKTYWSQIPGKYFTGDGARQDEDGYFWIMGRVDDVINVAGHRLSTMEIESALVQHPDVAEAAVVGFPHEIRGEGLYCFVVPKAQVTASEVLRRELCDFVAQQIGPIARPDVIQFAKGLPKTRSGKIMRRLLRDIAAGQSGQQDTTTLEDNSILESLRQGHKQSFNLMQNHQ